MRGCLRTIGCLTLLAILVCAGAWFTRDLWLPMIGLRPGRDVAAAKWEAPTAKGSGRADDALIQLESPRGAAFANVSPADLVAYVVASAGKSMPKSIDSIQAAVVSDRLYVRFRLSTEQLAKEHPGGFEKMGKYEHVELGGTLHVVRPGLTELQVKDLSVEGLRLPHLLVRTMLDQFGSSRPEGVASDGIAVATPKYIGDVRIANGKITVYRAAGNGK